MSGRDYGLDSIKQENTTEKEIPSFAYHPLGVRRTYGVVFTSTDASQQEVKLHYEIAIIHMLDQSGTNVLELQRQQVYINGKAPEKLIDQLTEQCGNVLYPLQISVDSLGQCIAIVNHKDIQQRWKQTKQNIQQSYSGEMIDTLLQRMEEMINDVAAIEEAIIDRDWFFTIFFAPIYAAAKKKMIAYPMIPYKIKVPYSAERTVVPHEHKEGDVLITIAGRCSDNRNERDIVRGTILSIDPPEEPITGTSKVTYQIYKNSPMVDAITGSCELCFPSGMEKKMNIEIYNLKEKIPKTAAEIAQEENEKEKEKPQPKKKKKRYFFFGKELKF